MSPHAVEPQTDGDIQSVIDDDGVYDLVCVGFGPASLAIAIALKDAISSHQPQPGLETIYRQHPKVLYLERQQSFRWHSGMKRAIQ